MLDGDSICLYKFGNSLYVEELNNPKCKKGKSQWRHLMTRQQAFKEEIKKEARDTNRGAKDDKSK